MISTAKKKKKNITKSDVSVHVKSCYCLKANGLFPVAVVLNLWSVWFIQDWLIDRLTPILVDAFPQIDNFNKLFEQTSETINIFWLVQYATI